MLEEWLKFSGWLILLCFILYSFVRIAGEAWFTAKGKFLNKYFFNKGENK